MVIWGGGRGVRGGVVLCITSLKHFCHTCDVLQVMVEIMATTMECA